MSPPLGQTLVNDEKLHRDCNEYREHLNVAFDAYKFCTQLLDEAHWKDKSGWKLECTNLELNERVYSRHVADIGKMFALTTLLDCNSVDLVFKVCHDDIEDTINWNPELVENFKVTDITDTCDVVYMASRDILGGLVKSRGFTDVRYYTKTDSDCTIVQKSVVSSELPPRNDHRITGKNVISVFKVENSHQIGKVAITWVTRIDLKGMLPTYVTDKTMHHFMPNYIRCLRQHLKTFTKQHEAEK